MGRAEHSGGATEHQQCCPQASPCGAVCKDYAACFESFAAAWRARKADRAPAGGGRTHRGANGHKCMHTQQWRIADEGNKCDGPLWRADANARTAKAEARRARLRRRPQAPGPRREL